MARKYDRSRKAHEAAVEILKMSMKPKPRWMPRVVWAWVLKPVLLSLRAGGCRERMMRQRRGHDHAWVAHRTDRKLLLGEPEGPRGFDPLARLQIGCPHQRSVERPLERFLDRQRDRAGLRVVRVRNRAGHRHQGHADRLRIDRFEVRDLRGNGEHRR